MNELTFKMPNDIELEKSILGVIINYPDYIITAVEYLKPQIFYDNTNKFIFEVLVSMFNANKPITVRTLFSEIQIKDSKFSDAFYISTLINNISTFGFEYNCMQISELFIRRELIKNSYTAFQEAQDKSIDLQDITDKIENSLTSALFAVKTKSYQHIKQIVDEYLKKINLIQTKIDDLNGIPSGFTSLDRLTSGWQAPDFIIIAARPSMGKTAFVINMIKNMLLFDKKVALFSLEMSNIQIINRLMVDLTSISKLNKQSLNQDEINLLYNNLSEMCTKDFFIDDSGNLSINEFKTKARLLKAKNKIEIIIIDYIQLMNDKAGKHGSRELEVSSIARNLKELAKELNIPIIALSQLNRGLETRSDKRPTLADLRESGALEQDSDIVMFIHRPEKFGILTDSDGNSTHGLAELIIAKHRNGAIGDIRLNFDEVNIRFTEPDLFSL